VLARKYSKMEQTNEEAGVRVSGKRINISTFRHQNAGQIQCSQQDKYSENLFQQFGSTVANKCKIKQWTYDVTLWSVRIIFFPRRLSYERDVISLKVSQFTGLSCRRHRTMWSGLYVKCPTFLSNFKQFAFSRQISLYVTTNKFH